MFTFEYKDRNDIDNTLVDFKALYTYRSNKIDKNDINYHDKEMFLRIEEWAEEIVL